MVFGMFFSILLINASYFGQDTVIIVFQNRVKHFSHFWKMKTAEIQYTERVYERPMVLSLPELHHVEKLHRKITLNLGKKKLAFVYADDRRILNFLNGKGYEVYVYRQQQDEESNLIQLSREYNIHFYNGVFFLIQLLRIKYLPALVEVKGNEATIIYGHPY